MQIDPHTTLKTVTFSSSALPPHLYSFYLMLCLSYSLPVHWVCSNPSQSLLRPFTLRGTCSLLLPKTSSNVLFFHLKVAGECVLFFPRVFLICQTMPEKFTKCWYYTQYNQMFYLFLRVTLDKDRPTGEGALEHIEMKSTQIYHL